jgi:hypothetical protein
MPLLAPACFPLQKRNQHRVRSVIGDFLKRIFEFGKHVIAVTSFPLTLLD